MAWTTIDNALYMWDYSVSNPELLGFEGQPHSIITVKLAKLKARIYEVPIVYHGRTYAEGKKINWTDGVAAFYHLIRFQLKD